MSDLDRQGWFSDAIRGLFAKLDSFQDSIKYFIMLQLLLLLKEKQLEIFTVEFS